MTLLLVDDEVLSIQAMESGVDWKACGVDKLLIATAPSKAKAILKTEHVDLLLMDIEMPEETGVQLLEWCRERGLQMPCAFLTCHANFYYARDAIRLGCQDYILKPVEYEAVEKTVKKMVSSLLLDDEKARFEEYGQQWVKEQARELKEEALASSDEAAKGAVEKTKEYIKEHLSEKLSLKDISARVHLNPDYLNRVFKKETGKPINRYIIEKRMNLAMELLKVGDVTASAVAERLGYDNYVSFVNMFKKTYGILPSQVKEQED